MQLFKKDGHVSFGRIVLWAFLLLVLFGIGSFLVRMGTYYVAIKRGDANPLLEQELQSSVSRAIANSKVTAEDLVRLANKDAPSFGPADAKLTIVEFSDFGCPFSEQSFAPVREAMQTYKDRVRFVLRDFPIEELHPRAMADAHAARCAKEQGKYWPMHDRLFSDQAHQEDTNLLASAKAIGLDEKQFSNCVQTKKYQTAIEQDIRDGLSAGVQGTPTFFFNGVKIQGALDAKTFNFLIDKFLEKSS